MKGVTPEQLKIMYNKYWKMTSPSQGATFVRRKDVFEKMAIEINELFGVDKECIAEKTSIPEAGQW